MSRGEALRFVTASLAKWLKYWASSAAICNDLFQQKEQAVQRRRVTSLVNPALSYCRAGRIKLNPQLYKQIGESETLRISISLMLL